MQREEEERGRKLWAISLETKKQYQNKTEMTARLSEDVQKRMLSGIPLGRFGEPKDVADLALFLSSESSSYITGQVIQIDGGMLM